MQKKKFKLLILLLMLFAYQPCFASNWVVLTPKQKISTANIRIQEGSSVEFVVRDDVLVANKVFIKRGTPATGIITTLIPNTWGGEPAKITIEQFDTFDVDKRACRLDGAVFKSGNSHSAASMFLILYWAIRGGEVNLKPYVDDFFLTVKGRSL